MLAATCAGRLVVEDFLATFGISDFGDALDGPKCKQARQRITCAKRTWHRL